jgi:linoleoyl-CoA desaturase
MFQHVELKPVAVSFQTQNQGFRKDVKEAIDAYFATTGKSRFATPAFWFRAVCMVLLYLGAYLAILLLQPGNALALLLCIAMGFGLAGIGFAISHQAAHGAISRSGKVNRAMSLSFNLVGMSDYMWHLKHDVFHHSYTNIYEFDEALKEDETFRFSENARWHSRHRFQHIYGFLAYGIFTIAWALWLDVDKWIRYRKFLKTEQHPTVERWIFWVTKLLYLVTMFYLPWLAGYSTLQIFTGYVVMNFVGSSLITHVLQVEHLNEKTFRAENTANAAELSWAENQLRGTSNFHTVNPLFNWYIAGVNHQIEHHLFPTINAAHYPAMSKIIREVAKKHHLEYTSFPSFFAAMRSHYRLLKWLGQKPDALISVV